MPSVGKKTGRGGEKFGEKRSGVGGKKKTGRSAAVLWGTAKFRNQTEKPVSRGRIGGNRDKKKDYSWKQSRA